MYQSIIRPTKQPMTMNGSPKQPSHTRIRRDSQSSQQAINQSVDQLVNRFSQQAIRQSIDKSVNQPTNNQPMATSITSIIPSISQSINHSTKHVLNRCVEQPTDQSSSQSVNEPSKHTRRHSTNPSINKPMHQDINESGNQLTTINPPGHLMHRPTKTKIRIDGLPISRPFNRSTNHSKQTATALKSRFQQADQLSDTSVSLFRKSPRILQILSFPRVP
jgi:hypothetical protein